MQNSHLLFDHSPWFILFCLMVGALYAFMLYQKQGLWSRNTNFLLGGLRFILVSLVTFLLLGPFFKQIRNDIEKPSFVIAVDNSMSLAHVMDSTALENVLHSISELKSSLEKQDHKVEVITLDEGNYANVLDIKFEDQQTDLNNLLKRIQSDYEGRNLAGTVLVTDGIYNQGISPSYVPYNFDIYSVGMGDTIPKTDLNLKTVYFNKIAYQGNKFPVVAEVINTGFEGDEIRVNIKRGNTVLASKTAVLKKSDQITNIEFTLDADKTGIQHYVVEVQPKEGEFTIENNTKHAYIDVVEGKEKILIVALAPHPDIKAFRNALEKNENYEFSVLIPGLQEITKEEKYDLIIFHQVPGQTTDERIKKYLDSQVPKWFIIGSNTDLNAFNSSNRIMKINVQRGERDKILPAFNDLFNVYNFKPEFRSIISTFPPVNVPFGKYELPGDAEILLYQRVGNVVTDKPLLVIGKDNNAKSAVMIGDGMWQWRLQEFAKTGKQEAFDELISKTIQYLSAKEDKRKFRVYPINNEIDDSEPVVFENEIYNEIFERIYNQDIDLEITSESGEKSNYNYTITEANSQYRIGGLKEGIYSYKASTSIKGQNEISQGAFTIKSTQLEALDLTANHNMLRRLSDQNSGKFFHFSEIQNLQDELILKEAKGIITSNVELLPIINMKWLFFVLLVIVSAEWFIRKFSGGY